MNKNIYPSLVVCLLAVFQLSAQSSINGYFKTNSELAVANFNLALADANGTILAQTQTDCEGYYHFDDLDANTDYQLVFEGLEQVPGSISTLDLILLNKHLYGIDEFTTLQAFAADIDDDGHVTVIDLLHLRNYTSPVNIAFPGVSWFIINSEQSQRVSEHQFTTAADTTTSVDFYYMRKGDVNAGAYGC